MFGKMKLEVLKTLYLDELEDAYDFEHQILDALPKMEKAATADEIAVYGTLREYARVLGVPEQSRLLQQTLDEEKGADQKLTKLAETGINIAAA